MIANSPADSALVTYTPGAVVIPEPNHMQDDEDDSPRSPEPAAVVFSQRITDRTVQFEVTQVARREEIRPDESDLREGLVVHERVLGELHSQIQRMEGEHLKMSAFGERVQQQFNEVSQSFQSQINMVSQLQNHLHMMEKGTQEREARYQIQTENAIRKIVEEIRTREGRMEGDSLKSDETLERLRKVEADLQRFTDQTVEKAIALSSEVRKIQTVIESLGKNIAELGINLTSTTTRMPNTDALHQKSVVQQQWNGEVQQTLSIQASWNQDVEARVSVLTNQLEEINKYISHLLSGQRNEPVGAPVQQGVGNTSMHPADPKQKGRLSPWVTGISPTSEATKAHTDIVSHMGRTEALDPITVATITPHQSLEAETTPLVGSLSPGNHGVTSHPAVHSDLFCAPAINLQAKSTADSGMFGETRGDHHTNLELANIEIEKKNKCKIFRGGLIEVPPSR